METVQRHVPAKKQPEGSEASRAIAKGTGVRLDSSAGRKIFSPVDGAGNFKTALPGVGRAWKEACVPWAGMANGWLPFLAICLELYSILLPTAKNIFAVKNVTLKARSGVSEEHRAELYRKREGAVSQDGTSRFLQNGRWSDFMMNVLILPWFCLRTQAQGLTLLSGSIF